MTVLLADDSFLLRERLQDMLGRFGQVRIAGSLHNGTEALQALRTLKPDLAIVDLKMPGLTGLEVLTEIRKEDLSLKFIILTYYATDYFRQMAMQAGADYFFSKIGDFEKLSLVVEAMLQKEGNIQPINNY